MQTLPSRIIGQFVRYGRHLAGVVLLAAAVFAVLVVAEGAPLRFGTDTAHAWHCVDMTATPSTIAVGESTTLSWSFAMDTDITVTIDGVPGVFEGVSGSTSVSPTETTTYVAVAHKTGTERTLQCSVTVTVTTPPPPPPPTPTCDDIDMHIDGTVLTWNNCPRMDSYEVTFCDGTHESVTGPWREDVSLDLGKRIQEVRAKGGDCEKTATQSCPPPPTPDPEWPACPFTASADTKVIAFDGKGLLANGSEADATSSTYPLALPAGSYKVQTASWDGYSWRASDDVQPYEQWYLTFENTAGTEVARTRATTDLADGVIESLRVDDPLEASLELASSVSSITAHHAKYPYDARNSVQPVCVAVTTLTPPAPLTPVCTISASPASIKKGQSATLTWDGTQVRDGVIDQGVGTVTSDGSKTVSPTTTTTYTGSFTADDGSSVSCSATLTVRTGGGGGPCLNCEDDDDDDDDQKDEVLEDDEKSDLVTPSIVLAKTITKAGSYVTLDQVPYTGFEAGPFVTVLFWLAILVASVLIAYVVTRIQPIARLRTAYSSRSELVGDTNTVEPAAYVPLAPRGLMYQASPVAMNILSQRAFVPGIASDDGAGKIESAAHAENILLSPEATRLIMQTIATSGRDTDTFLADLFARVVATYQREDGWILLSQDRATKIIGDLGNRMQGAAVAVETASAPVATMNTSHDERPYRNVEMASAPASLPIADDVRSGVKERTEQINVDSVVPLFVDLLVVAEQRKAFELMRRLTAQGVPPEVFVMQVIRKLDDVYKNRIEGNHNPDKDLAAKTATWSNADFEKVLSILVECVDYSYTSNRVGTKVALTKLFEYFAK